MLEDDKVRRRPWHPLMTVSDLTRQIKLTLEFGFP